MDCDFNEWGCLDSNNKTQSLPLYKVCNGVIDCYDGVDETEMLCTKHFCKTVLDKWKCFNETKCSWFQKQFACDGHIDCEMGGNETKEACDEICPAIGGWACPDEAKCIGMRQLCDGENHCRNGADEADKLCSNTFCKTELGRWKCPNDTLCVQMQKVCDGVNDCKNGLDGQEDMCTQEFCANQLFVEYQSFEYRFSSRSYKIRDWKCPNETKCIRKANVCNGRYDCVYGTDEGEALCTKEYCEKKLDKRRWKCPNEPKCLSKKWMVCDGYKHCSDGADESELFCKKDSCEKGLDKGRFSCPNEISGNQYLVQETTQSYRHFWGFKRQKASSESNEIKCISNLDVCDGRNDCQGGADETLCTVEYCKNSLDREWKCPNETKCLS